MTAKLFGAASSIAGLAAISILADDWKEWLAGWLLLVAWLLGRASDDIARSSRGEDA